MYEMVNPIIYQNICFIQRFENSLDNNVFVEYIEIILIIHNNIMGIKILYSILNLLMFLIRSLPNY